MIGTIAAQPELQRINWVVCGRFVGTGTGWDQSHSFSMMINDFAPCEELKNVIPACASVDFDFERGEIYANFDENGIPSVTLDLIETLTPCKKMQIEPGMNQDND